MGIDIQNYVEAEKIAAITNFIVDDIRKLLDKGIPWDDITEKIVGEMKNRDNTPYIIFADQKCDYPKGCIEGAFVGFIYERGVVFSCFIHYKETEKKIHG